MLVLISVCFVVVFVVSSIVIYPKVSVFYMPSGDSFFRYASSISSVISSFNR